MFTLKWMTLYPMKQVSPTRHTALMLHGILKYFTIVVKLKKKLNKLFSNIILWYSRVNRQFIVSTKLEDGTYDNYLPVLSDRVSDSSSDDEPKRLPNVLGHRRRHEQLVIAIEPGPGPSTNPFETDGIDTVPENVPESSYDMPIYNKKYASKSKCLRTFQGGPGYIFSPPIRQSDPHQIWRLTPAEPQLESPPINPFLDDEELPPPPIELLTPSST